MKCLTITQSNAYLIVWGIKDVENRGWSTRFRGTIGIHTSLGDDSTGFDGLEIFEDFKRCRRSADDTYPDASGCSLLDNDADGHLILRSGDPEHERQLGLLRYMINAPDDHVMPQAIIGTVDIIDVVQDSGSRWADPGKYYYVLSNPQRFDIPIMGVRGMPGFWDYEIESREVIA